MLLVRNFQSQLRGREWGGGEKGAGIKLTFSVSTTKTVRGLGTQERTKLEKLRLILRGTQSCGFVLTK